MDNITGIKECICPVCENTFIKPVSNTYKLKIKDKTFHYCSYTCYRKVQKEKEEKKRKYKRKDHIKGAGEMSKEKYIKAGGRCRETLYLFKHKCIKYKGMGYRCKYCKISLSTLLEQEYKRK